MIPPKIDATQTMILVCALAFALLSCSSSTTNQPLQNNSGDSIAATTQPEKALDTSKAYVQAIAEYMKAMSKTDAPAYDTLFIGNPELLPEIRLPDTIEKKRIILFTRDAAEKHPEKSGTFLLINIGWAAFEKDPVEFMFFTFYNDARQKLPFGFNPKHQSYIYLHYDSAAKEFKLNRAVRFEDHTIIKK